MSNLRLTLLMICTLLPNLSYSKITLDKFLGQKFRIHVQLKNKNLANNLCSVSQVFIDKTYNSPQTKCLINQKKKDDLSIFKIKHSFLIKIKGTENDPKVITIEATYLDADNLDVKKLSWKIQRSKGKIDKDLRRSLKNLISYEKNRLKYRDSLLKTGSSFENDMMINPVGTYRIYNQKYNTERIVSKDIALKIYTKKGKRQRNYFRAALEIAGYLGIGRLMYEITSGENAEDWDLTNDSFSDYINRLTTGDQIAYDDNSIMMNWGHVYAGKFYYMAGRSNGFSSIESFLISNAASSLWGFAFENKEYISPNDQIITGVGGSILSETFFQIANMLNGKNNSITAKILSTMLNTTGTINNFFDSKSYEEAHMDFSKEYGFSGDNYEQFDIILGLRHANKSDPIKDKVLVEFGFETEVINLPVNEVGNIKEIVYDTLIADLTMKSSLSTDGFENFHVTTKAVLAGYFAKNIKLDQNGKKSGYSFIVGPSVGTEYRSDGVDHNDELYAVVNVFGGTIDLTYYAHGVECVLLWIFMLILPL